MRGKYLIAVCDILGFSRLVADNSLESVVDNALGWFRKALMHSLHGGTFPAMPPPTRELDHEHVGVAWFSDTILLYTKHDTDEAVGELLQAVSALLFETIIPGVTKIRAGIAYGEAYLDPENSMYVGRPIVEAYKLEKNQEWAGAALSPSACERLDQCGSPSGDVARWWVTPWEVPTKDQTLIAKYAVNWTRHRHELNWRLLWSESSDLPPADAVEKCPDVYRKFMNTTKFHETLCEDCRRR